MKLGSDTLLFSYPFIVLNIITNKIAFIGIIIVVLEATLAISQKDIKKIWSFPQLSCISSCYVIILHHPWICNYGANGEFFVKFAANIFFCRLFPMENISIGVWRCL